MDNMFPQWLLQFLGNQGGSPGGFGALGAGPQSPAAPQPTQAQAGMMNTIGPGNTAGPPMNINPGTMPAAGGANMQLPGLLGQFAKGMAQGGNANSPIMNQAMKFLQPPQMTPTSWMPWMK